MRIAGQSVNRATGEGVGEGGEFGYLAWVEDCFSPAVYFVRGENHSDAYANFICSDAVKFYKIETAEDARDYDYDSVEDLFTAWANGEVGYYLEVNDNGELVDTESIRMMSISAFRHHFRLFMD